jgi:hypothetical protein
MCIYGESDHSRWFREAWAKTGKKLDMGKACVRFKKVEDLALDVIGEAIKRVPARRYIEHCEAATSAASKKPTGQSAKSGDRSGKSKSGKRGG